MASSFGFANVRLSGQGGDSAGGRSDGMPRWQKERVRRPPQRGTGMSKNCKGHCLPWQNRHSKKQSSTQTDRKTTVNKQTYKRQADGAVEDHLW